jgi:hypothetical protein
MNVQMGDLRDAMRIRMPGDASSPAPEPAPEPTPTPNAGIPTGTADKADGAAQAAGVVDPMQWWGALTQQFSQLATNALKDGAAEVTKNLPGASALAEAAAKVMQPSPKKAAAKPAKAAAKRAPTRKRPASKKTKGA